MHKTAIALASTLLLSGTALNAGPRLEPEQRLAKALSGRVAGEPTDCIQLRSIRSSQIIDRTAILYEMIGGDIYLNRPDSGASTLDSLDILVTDTHSPQLCDIDIVRLYNQSAHMQTGFVSLGKFVPYRKVPAAKPR